MVLNGYMEIVNFSLFWSNINRSWGLKEKNVVRILFW